MMMIKLNLLTDFGVWWHVAFWGHLFHNREHNLTGRDADANHTSHNIAMRILVTTTKQTTKNTYKKDLPHFVNNFKNIY